MAQERRLEWFLSIEVEIKKKASIVFDDGRKRSKIGKPYVGLIMEIFEEVQVQNKKKNTRKLFSVKKASGIRITGSLHSKSLDKTGKRQKKWWDLPGLNQRPSDYESPALTTELRSHVRIVI